MYLWLVLGEKRHRARALVRSYLDHVRGDTDCGAQSWGEECTAGVSSNQSGAPVRGQRRTVTRADERLDARVLG